MAMEILNWQIFEGKTALFIESLEGDNEIRICTLPKCYRKEAHLMVAAPLLLEACLAVIDGVQAQKDRKEYVAKCMSAAHIAMRIKLKKHWD